MGIGYSDSDYAGCVDSRKSTFAYMLMLARGAISWKSGKQSVIATSTMKDEFVACFEAIVHALWLRNFIFGLDIVYSIVRPLRINCDNFAVDFFSKNDKYSKGAKHMDLKYLIVKEEVQKHKVSIEHIWLDMMIANPLTKGLLPKIFIGHVERMRIIDKSLLALYLHMYIYQFGCLAHVYYDTCEFYKSYVFSYLLVHIMLYIVLFK